VILSGIHDRRLEKPMVDVVDPHSFSAELEFLSGYVLSVGLFSSISLTKSGLKNHRSPGSDQFKGVQHRRPYRASNDAILILS
jgi:hypothetical protein